MQERQISPGDDPLDPRKLFRPGGIDTHNTGMRIFAPEHFPVKHATELYILHINGSPCYLALRIQADGRFSNKLVLFYYAGTIHCHLSIPYLIPCFIGVMVIVMYSSPALSRNKILEFPDFCLQYFRNLLNLYDIFALMRENPSPFGCSPTLAQIPLRSLKRILDHSRARFTANPKLALWAQTLDLRSFRFTKNG